MKNERDCLNILTSYYQKNAHKIDTSFNIEPIKPIYVGFKVTELCDQFCSHCWAGKNTIYKSKKEIFKAMDKIYEMNILHFTITGGEPFVREDILDIIKYAIKLFPTVEIFTNAQALNEKIIDSLKNMLSKDDFVQISLDGLKDSYKLQRGVDSFDKVIENIKILKKHNINIRVNSTATNINIDDILHVYDLVKKLNIQTFSLSLVYELRKGENQRNDILLSKYEKILNEIKKDLLIYPKDFIVRLFTPLEIQSIYAKKEEKTSNDLVYFNDNILHWTIDAEGNIFNYLDHYKYSDLLIGNIYDDSLCLLLENSKRIQRKIAVRVLNDEKCLCCNLVKKCKGGDYICNYPNINKADKRCKFNVKG